MWVLIFFFRSFPIFFLFSFPSFSFPAQNLSLSLPCLSVAVEAPSSGHHHTTPPLLNEVDGAPTTIHLHLNHSLSTPHRLLSTPPHPLQADTDKDGRLTLTEMIENPYVFYSAIFNDDDDEDYGFHDEFR